MKNFFRHFSHTTLMRKKPKPERIIGGLGLNCVMHEQDATRAACAQWMADAVEAAAAVAAGVAPPLPLLTNCELDDMNLDFDKVEYALSLN
jgi:hypothetical protein